VLLVVRLDAVESIRRDFVNDEQRRFADARTRLDFVDKILHLRLAVVFSCFFINLVVVVIPSSSLKVLDRGTTYTHQFSPTLPVSATVVHSVRVLPIQSLISFPCLSLLLVPFRNVCTEVLCSDYVTDILQLSLSGSG